MASELSPAYQWYVKDWRSSRATLRMSFAERGVYREMLDQQWEDLSLPDDPHAVADLIATSQDQIAEVLAAWPVVRRKFVVIPDQPGRIHNIRLERLREDRRRYKERQSLAGQARAQAEGSRNGGGRFSPASHQPATSQEPANHQPATKSAFAFASASAFASEEKEKSASLSLKEVKKDEKEQANDRKCDPFINPAITERAGRFLERYQDLYQTHRKGARYALKPTRDYAAAVTLCHTWSDERLDKLAVIFLTTDHKFAEEGSRTVPQFLALASWCDGKLAEHESRKAAI